jgi:hypothetical protein
MMENTGSRSRSKSRSRKDPRRKIGVKAPCNDEVKRPTSFTHPTCGLPFSSPMTSKSKVFSTSMPSCTFSPISPEAPNRDSSLSRQVRGGTGVEKQIKKQIPALRTGDDGSIDEFFKTLPSDNVQTAHQRTSSGRVSMSRRNLCCDNQSYEVSPKGSHSLHVTRCTLEESTFDFGAAQSENLFAPQPPLTSPSFSTKSSDASKWTGSFETPAKPFSKRQLSIGSPAGVEDFPSIDTPDGPGKKNIDLAAKYKQEVERTVARLERMREKRRTRAVPYGSTTAEVIARASTEIGG